MKIFEHIEGLVSSKIDVAKSVMTMVKLETKLAGMSIYSVLLNLCFLMTALISVWAASMFLLGYLISLALNSPLMGVVGVLLFNLILIIVTHAQLKSNLKKMSFEKTRDYFSPKGKHADARLTRESDGGTGHDGKEIKIPGNAGTHA